LLFYELWDFDSDFYLDFHQISRGEDPNKTKLAPNIFSYDFQLDFKILKESLPKIGLSTSFFISLRSEIF